MIEASATELLAARTRSGDLKAHGKIEAGRGD